MIEKFEEIPEKLQSIKSPPKELFYVGDLGLLQKRCVGIVGSRKSSRYSQAVVFEIASKLSARNTVIVSGGAIGIDTVAHEGAKRNTIAVFANSLDVVYPKINKNLIEKIYQNSLAISEQSIGCSPTKYSFVLRNRLVVGLSDALLVAEADEGSGSLRSAEFARQEGKQIYVLPQRLGESKGTYRLLKEGIAKEILDVDAFVEEYSDNTTFHKNNDADDAILCFCATTPSYEDAIKRYGEKIFEYELEGKISVVNGFVRIVR